MSTPAKPLTGEVLDQKYEVHRCLGHGGSGSVFLARHVYMERNVAVKVLHPNFAADESFCSRFLREAQLTSRLNHPNIVTVHDFGVHEQRPYLVMEYVQGQTLRDRLLDRGALDISELVDIGSQVCQALRAAHAIGVVHRDLKPENVIVSGSDGELCVRVLDFGIAKLFQTNEISAGAQITEEGLFQGTPRYASPEQIRNQDIDGRSDIYSFGVMLYEILVGHPPFESSAPMDLVLMHLNAKVTPPRERRQDLLCSDRLETLILKCLEKDSACRFPDVETLCLELEACDGTRSARARRRDPWENVGMFGALSTLLMATALYVSNSDARQPIELTPRRPTIVEEPPKLMTEAEQVTALLAEGQKSYYKQDYFDAAAICRSVLTRKPDDVQAKLYLSLAYKKLGRTEEAITLLESLDPSLQENQKVAYQLAVLNAKIGKIDKALDHLALATKDNVEIKHRAKEEKIFAPLAKNVRYRKLVAEASEPKAAQARPKRRDSSIERSFGLMLESVNRGMKDIF